MERKSKKKVIIIAVAAVLAAAIAAGVILFTGSGKIEKKANTSLIESAKTVYSMLDNEDYTKLTDEERENIGDELVFSISNSDENGNETVTDRIPFAKNGDCYFYEETQFSSKMVRDTKNSITYEDIGLSGSDDIKYISVLSGEDIAAVYFTTDLDVICSISLSTDKEENGITAVYGNDGKLLFAQKENADDGVVMEYYNSDAKKISGSEFNSLVEAFKAENSQYELILTNIG